MSTVFGVLREDYRDLAGREEEVLLLDSIRSIEGYEDSYDDSPDAAFDAVAKVFNDGSCGWKNPIAYLLPDSTPVFALDNVSDIKTIGEIRNLIEK